MPAFMYRLLLNFYPPFLGAGISVEYISKDFSCINVRLQLYWWNRNYVGTHFGGSLYSMCDPFFMFMLSKQLGKDYVVWDQGASIKFIKPGIGRVKARFCITKDEVSTIIENAGMANAVKPVFYTEILNKENAVIAIVKKELYVSKKR